MLKIAHEAPLSLMRDIRSVTDYCYALVHLFEDETNGSEYFDFFIESKLMGREVILDNSIFELGKAFDLTKYFNWIRCLKPTAYIVPDVLDDGAGTLRSFDHWMEVYGSQLKSDPEYKDIKIIAVAQGNTFEDLYTCFDTLNKNPLVDKVAISFNYKWYNEQFPESPTLEGWMKGRQLFVDIVKRLFNPTKPVHLLGCSLPQEFSYYNKSGYEFIESVDTSNPVIHGLHKVPYLPYGLDDKISMKMVELFESKKPWISELNVIYTNITKFKEFCNG